MDNSLSKALIMVAGILLAVIVIGFMTFSFRRIGTWAQATDAERLAEQNAKFNKEYEVYDKDLMYGVDVISCLNKALSNNDAIEGKYAEAKDESYEVQVKVTINSPLEEAIKVYYIEDNKKEFAYTTGEGPSNVKLEDVGFNFFGTDYEDKISTFKENASLVTQNKEIDGVKIFTLTKEKTGAGEAELRALLSVANTLSEVVKNPDKENRTKENSWTKAEFKSALYDLKTRKFKCTNLEYSEAGRVNYIEFKEI